MFRLKSGTETVDTRIRESLTRLEAYILGAGYAGYDPYDALMSPLFRVPFLRTNRLLRFGAQQVVKRLPVNVRRPLRIPRGRNPVTFGLCLQGFTYLQSLFPERKEIYDKEAAYCLRMLQELQSKGYGGACWGYDFDWESRFASFPAFTPTVVATGMITNALFVHHTLTANAEALDLCRSAVRFVVKDLHRSYDEEMFCFSYSPRDSQRVLNATMKGARLLIQMYSKTNNEELKGLASATVRFVLKHQRSTGAWPYTIGDVRSWTDNFHTGYVLDCLDDYVQATHDSSARDALDKGVAYYRRSFLQDGILPKYFDNAVYPIDTTAAAQSILTLARFGFVTDAMAVAGWMIDTMQDREGYFYYRAYHSRVVRTSFMRWSNAWMFLALSYLLYRRHALV